MRIKEIKRTRPWSRRNCLLRQKVPNMHEWHQRASWGAKVQVLLKVRRSFKRLCIAKRHNQVVRKVSIRQLNLIKRPRPETRNKNQRANLTLTSQAIPKKMPIQMWRSTTTLTKDEALWRQMLQNLAQTVHSRHQVETIAPEDNLRFPSTICNP